jgi:hypothetical protein
VAGKQCEITTFCNIEKQGKPCAGSCRQLTSTQLQLIGSAACPYPWLNTAMYAQSSAHQQSHLMTSLLRWPLLKLGNPNFDLQQHRTCTSSASTGRAPASAPAFLTAGSTFVECWHFVAVLGKWKLSSCMYWLQLCIWPRPLDSAAVELHAA